jgi:hypothetical protein
MKKIPHLVVYDYGMGGVWAVILADNDSKIISKYPKLQVVAKRPSWMNEEEYKKIKASNTFDIDSEPHGWLISAMAEK